MRAVPNGPGNHGLLLADQRRRCRTICGGENLLIKFRKHFPFKSWFWLVSADDSPIEQSVCPLRCCTQAMRPTDNTICMQRVQCVRFVSLYRLTRSRSVARRRRESIAPSRCRQKMFLRVELPAHLPSRHLPEILGVLCAGLQTLITFWLSE